MTSRNIRKLSHSEMDLYRKPLLPKTWSCFPVDKDIDTQMLRKILQKDLRMIYYRNIFNLILIKSF